MALDVDADPNGCPFSRARLTVDPGITDLSAAQLAGRLAAQLAAQLAGRLAEGDPTVVVRAHHVDEGYINLDASEMTDAEIHYVCDRIRSVPSDPTLGRWSGWPAAQDRMPCAT